MLQLIPQKYKGLWEYCEQLYSNKLDNLEKKWINFWTPKLTKMESWRNRKLPTSVFLLGEIHGQRRLVGYSSRGCKVLDTSERLTYRPKRSKYWIEVALVVKNPPANAGDTWQYSCLENPMDREVWWVMVHSVTKSQTQLKQLTMHTLNR